MAAFATRSRRHVRRSSFFHLIDVGRTDEYANVHTIKGGMKAIGDPRSRRLRTCTLA